MAKPPNLGRCPMVSKGKKDRSHKILTSKDLALPPPLKVGETSWKSGMSLQVCTVCEGVGLTATDEKGKTIFIWLSPPKPPHAKK